ncbi:TIGR03089 family protein [Nocardioides carbamazepini]|uniref:TIGR03089 family protein n=1 Tax=Nocardioides carbamazepini TaxID=2854259 RepID=UPI002149D6DD|nr:TIGR03089 family protein [Nocardioides carbamazepini]MCR1782728.1 TIGR03089 family protein [Nocardioides carbamazepini]
MTTPTTFPAVLAARLRTDPGQPLVTFYDHATGERVELSVTTWANWVAKASSLLVDELGLERGDRIALDLPPHWLGTVFLGAAWNCGLTVAAPDDADLVAVACGPDSLPDWSGRAAELAVLACALLPLGVRFAEPVPAGVTDVGVDIWSQPDAFQAWDPPQPDELAIETAGRSLTPAPMGSEAAGTGLVGAGRLLTVADPVMEPAILCEPLLSGGSLVLVARAEPERLEATYVAEHATARFPA